MDHLSYPGISYRGEKDAVHRFVWKMLNGPIPKGIHIHHTCGNRRCFNPEHLQPLTPSEHWLAHNTEEP